MPGVLPTIAAIALVLAVLDGREVIQQLDESHTGIAVLALIVAILHLATAVISGQLARHPPPAAS